MQSAKEKKSARWQYMEKRIGLNSQAPILSKTPKIAIKIQNSFYYNTFSIVSVERLVKKSASWDLRLDHSIFCLIFWMMYFKPEIMKCFLCLSVSRKKKSGCYVSTDWIILLSFTLRRFTLRRFWFEKGDYIVGLSHQGLYLSVTTDAV